MGKSVMDGLQYPVQVRGVQIEPEPESIFSIYQLKNVVQDITDFDLVIIPELAHRVVSVLPADEPGQGFPLFSTVVHHHAHFFVDGFAHILSFQVKMSSMCGRYTLYETKDLGPRFNLATQPKFVSQDNYNVAPRQWLPVIVEDQEKGRIAEPKQWGFIPPWSKDPSKGPRPIHNRSETAVDSRMWKGAVNPQC